MNPRLLASRSIYAFACAACLLLASVPSARAQIALEGVLTCPAIANTYGSATLSWTVDGQFIASDQWDCGAHCTSQPESANGWQLIVQQYSEFGGVINSCSKSGSFQAGHPLNLSVTCGGQLAFKLRKGKGC